MVQIIDHGCTSHPPHRPPNCVILRRTHGGDALPLHPIRGAPAHGILAYAQSASATASRLGPSGDGFAREFCLSRSISTALVRAAAGRSMSSTGATRSAKACSATTRLHHDERKLRAATLDHQSRHSRLARRADSRKTRHRTDTMISIDKKATPVQIGRRLLCISNLMRAGNDEQLTRKIDNTATSD